jgi:hypothetical protein
VHDPRDSKPDKIFLGIFLFMGTFMLYFSKWLFENDNIIDDLNTVFSIQETIKTVEQHGLEQLGLGNNEGTTRIVFKHPNNKQVIKIPRQTTYLKYNFNEIKSFACLGKEYAAEITEFHPKGYWLIMELVKPFKDHQEFNQKLQQVLNLPDTINDERFLYKAVVQFKEQERLKLSTKLCHSSEWFRKLTTKLSSCEVGGQDLNWFNFGLRESTGELVMLDYADLLTNPAVQQPCSI